MLKSLSAGVAALALLSVAAQAQDYGFQGWQGLPPPGGAFGGLQVGADLGAAIGGTGDVSPTGAAGGVHAGYNLQNGPLVGGLEGDVLFGSISGDGRGGTLNQNFMSSVRVRGGYAFGNVLAYGTIGPAWGSSSFQRNGFTFDKTLNGYTFGVGGEVAITRNISARAELRHYEFNSATYYMSSGVQKLSAGNNLLMVGAGVHF